MVCSCRVLVGILGCAFTIVGFAVGFVQVFGFAGFQALCGFWIISFLRFGDYWLGFGVLLRICTLGF